MRSLGEDERISICRFCHACCGIGVRVENGRPVEIRGDADHPVSRGFTCAKGRALPEQHSDPGRLLHSVERADAGFRPVTSARAMDEIARRLTEIVEESGPRSVAVFRADGALHTPSSVAMAMAFLEALGSPMYFDTGAIDQPGKVIAAGLHGHWAGGPQPFAGADVWLILGTNPLVSMWGGPIPNPGHWMRRAKQDGMQLIVIDPRRTETAELADLFLQPRPGEDPAILAGILRVILTEGLVDRAFLAEDVAGVEALRAAVEPFTPEYVSHRADVPAEAIEEAARMFATAGRGMNIAGTGPNMAPHGTLTEYLLLCLSTVCGRWQRAGERPARPPVTQPVRSYKAQAEPPRQPWGNGERMRVRGLVETEVGMPVPALAEEILLPGEGQVRALICLGANPVVTWPDQPRTLAAFDALDLAVSLDVKLTPTAKLCDYVIAPKMSLESDGMTYFLEQLDHWVPTNPSLYQPFAQVVPPAVDPPADSEVIDDWQFFYGIAQRMGLPLSIAGQEIDMEVAPTTEDLHRILLSDARISFDEIRAAPHGGLWEDPALVVEKKDEGWPHRLDVGNSMMMDELRQVLAEHAAAAGGANGQPVVRYPYRLISRRMKNVYNSIGIGLPSLSRDFDHNPTFMNPSDMARDGLVSGDRISIESDYGRIEGIVQAADDVRTGVLSMAHCWGGVPDEHGNSDAAGFNTNVLIDTTTVFDPITAIPRMSAIPVAISRLSGEPAVPGTGATERNSTP